MADEVRATRRRHSAELKARILAACAEPGASIARIALENGLNTNLVQTWRRRARSGGRSVARVVADAEFVPVPVLPTAAMASERDIRISIRRGGTSVEIQWPIQDAATCAQWLRELLG
jgi:transposase